MKFLIKQWIQSYLPPAILNNLIHKKKWKDLSLKGPKRKSKEEYLQDFETNRLHQPVKKTNRKNPTPSSNFAILKIFLIFRSGD